MNKADQDLVYIPEEHGEDKFEVSRKFMIERIKRHAKMAEGCEVEERTDEEYNECIDTSEMISASSKEAYKYRLGYIKKRYRAASIHQVLTNPVEYAIAIIDDNKEMKNKENSLSAVQAYLAYSGLKDTCHVLFSAWYPAFILVHKEWTRLRKSNIPTQRQLDSMLEWRDVINKRNDLAYGSLEHIVLSMHTYVPPRRQLDYTRMRVYADMDIDPPQTENYFQLYNKRLGAPVLFYKEYKTAKYFSTFLNKEVPIEFSKVVGKSILDNPREYLIVNPKTGVPYDDKDFRNKTNAVLKKIFNNKGVSVNTLRHSFINFVSQGPYSLVQRERFSMKMGHTLTKNMEYVLFQGQKEEIRTRKNDAAGISSEGVYRRD